MVELDVQIAHEQSHIRPVVIETTTPEYGIRTIHVRYQVEFPILEEITIFEGDVL